MTKISWIPPLPPCPLCGADTQTEGFDISYEFFLNEKPIVTIPTAYVYCSHTWECGYRRKIDDIIYNTDTGWVIKYCD